MNSIETLTTFFGWCTVISICLIYGWRDDTDMIHGADDDTER